MIEQSRQGDVDAFGQLVRRYQEVAFRVAYVITGSAQDAEEAAQDGFTKAYFALNRFRTDAPFRPWLLQIVANSARNRRDSANRHFSFSLNESIETGFEREIASPEAQLIEQDETSALLNCLNGLRPDDRAVITCRYFLDLTEAEMAAALGIARGTVKSRLSRALHRMRTALQAKGLNDAY